MAGCLCGGGAHGSCPEPPPLFGWAPGGGAQKWLREGRWATPDLISVSFTDH